MASATGIPDAPILNDEDVERVIEEPEMEPLLGRPGDASQVTGTSMVRNLVLGKSSHAACNIIPPQAFFG